MLPAVGGHPRHTANNWERTGNCPQTSAQRCTGRHKPTPPAAKPAMRRGPGQCRRAVIRRTSELISSKLNFKHPVLGRIAIVPVTVISGLLSRIASRKSRLIRVRRAAGPILLETSTHQAKRSAGRQTREKQFPINRCPSLSKPVISSRLFKLRDRGNLFFPANLRCQSLAPFGTTAGQHFAAVFGRHPGPETVVVEFLPVRRLKCSFHSFVSFLRKVEPPIYTSGWQGQAERGAETCGEKGESG
jgi:hypothetical protein